MDYRKQMILWCGGVLLASLFLNSLEIFANYKIVSENGSDKQIGVTMGLALIPLAIMFVLNPVSLVGLIFKRTRKVCFIIFVCGILYFSIFVVCIRIGNIVRMAGFRDLAERSRHLVQAIEKYEAKYGTCPAALDKLVPEFLPEVPNTGMGAYPEYEYKVGEEAQKFAGDKWCLIVETPSGVINWDIFIYFPKQDYPERGYGGVLEKIGDWAYVHE